MNTDVPRKLVEDIERSREELKKKKPRVYEKLMKYLEAEKNGDGIAMSLVDFSLNFECNFNCTHCSARILRHLPGQRGMSMKDVKIAADECDKVGIFIFNLIGGEPLLWLPQFEDLIKAIDPSRFHISITTNGWLLSPEVAKKLKAYGVDKVGVSIDSGLGPEHDAFRNQPGAFEHAIQAVRNSLAAGIRTIISTVVTHESVHSDGFRRMLEISKELGVGLDIQCATVSGAWTGNLDLLIDEEDAEYLEGLRKEYPLLRRDVWTTPGSRGGCPAGTRSIYVLASGDVVPCLFIHATFGNILKEPLADILGKMRKLKEFREFSEKCLAGEDREFINKYMKKIFDKETALPVDYREVFEEEKILNKK